MNHRSRMPSGPTWSEIKLLTQFAAAHLSIADGVVGMGFHQGKGLLRTEAKRFAGWERRLDHLGSLQELRDRLEQALAAIGGTCRVMLDGREYDLSFGRMDVIVRKGEARSLLIARPLLPSELGGE